jgi:hypothetical protein
MDRVGRISRTRAACHHDNAWTAGHTRRGIGHHGGPAFLAADGERDRAVVQRIEDRKITLTGHAEDVLDALRNKLIDENLSACPVIG